MPFKHKRTLPRKRRRGLRRHWRKHQQRATVPTPPNLPFIAEYHYDYDQLGLAPWTVHGRPPVAFRRLWAERLLADLRQWREQLTPLYPDLYLAIYLYNVRFGKSEVVAATGKRKAYYEQSLGDAQPIPLPTEYQSLPGVAELTWTAHAEVDVFSPEEFAELGRWGTRHRHWRATTTEDDDCIVVQTGDVWVGRVRTT
jgi:hypothetical protein